MTHNTAVAVKTIMAEQELLLNALAAMTCENDRLEVLTDDLEIIGQLNPNGIFRTDRTGKVTYANKQWLRIVGVAALGPASDHWISRVHAEDAEALRADWARALSEPGFKFAREFRLLRGRHGVTSVWINVKSLAETVVPVRQSVFAVLPKTDEPGTASSESPLPLCMDAAPALVRAVVGAFTDVTVRKRQEQRDAEAAKEQEEKRQEAEKQLEESTETHRREQERFVDVICHEIRNPLNGIVNSLEQLRQGRRQLQVLVQQAINEERGTAQAPLLAAILTQLDDDVAMLGAIDLCAFHQRRITDDVLHISRLRLGRYSVEDEDFEVIDLVSRTVAMFRAEARVRHIGLEFTPPEAPQFVRGDAQRISQMLSNLLSNAIKFTWLAVRGSIRVHAAAVRDDNKDDAAEGARCATLVVSVADAGTGMTPDELANLFLPYGQGTSKSHTTYGRSSMGLFITKELLALMGGSIHVGSAPDQGSTFTLEIPVTVVEAPAAARPDSTDGAPLASPRTTPAPPSAPVSATGCHGAGAHPRPLRILGNVHRHILDR